MARHLVEDFPQAKFVHTIRDPISSCDGVFHFLFGTFVRKCSTNLYPSSTIRRSLSD